MKIRKTTWKDLEGVLELYAQARAFMKANGNPDQWGDSYPPTEQVKQDIEEGKSYVCEEDARLLGTFFFSTVPDPDYLKIYEGAWLGTGSYGVMHRVAAPGARRGVATFCVNWCMEQCGDLRIDTHQDNVPMQRMLEKNGFTRCGVVHLAKGGERIAFEKVNPA